VLIKAIIFDIGGVVINDDFISYAKRFTKKSGLMEKEIYKAVLGSPEWRLCFKGKLSEKDAWSVIRKKYLPPEIADEIRSTWKEILIPMKATMELIKKLKAGYRIYALSNVDSDCAKHIIKKYKKIYGLFDGCVFSCNVGMAKPEKSIYLCTLKKFGLNPKECIFIDNQPENLPPARELGMKAVRFESASKLNHQLTRLGIKF
jgi:putative hydrolase of the HAD superfamily